MRPMSDALMGETTSKLSWVGRVAGALLGAIFLVAAWAKLLDPTAFASGEAMAILAIGLEVGLGLALVLGLRKLWVLLPTGVLIVLFLSLTGRSYWLWSQGLLEDDAACGCFGNLVQRTPAEAFWQDLLMMVPLFALAWLGRNRDEGWSVPRMRSTIVGVMTVAGMLFAWRAPSLPLDDLATRLKPGVAIETICAGGETDADSICLDVLIPGLAEGEHWVVISELDNEMLLRGMDSLNELAAGGMEERLTVLSADPAEAHQPFFWRYGPAFEIREVPLAMVRPLYRSTPRSFRLQDGKVTATAAGLPPQVVIAPPESEASPSETQ
jgi:uncharacterized membrane protein YphA (DoxX/SURF4 family)